MNESATQLTALYDKAIELYKRLGIKSVSMDDVARELGISKKTLYQLVANKEELVAKVMEADFEKDKAVFERHQRESRDAIDEFLRNSRYFIREMRQMAPAAIHDLQKYYPATWKFMSETHHAEFGRNLVENIERGMEEGLYRDDLDPTIVSTLYSGMMLMVIDRRVFPALDRPFSEIILHQTKYHFNGIVNQFGRERLEHYLSQESLG